MRPMANASAVPEERLAMEVPTFDIFGGEFCPRFF
jgi:hypothetical protein